MSVRADIPNMVSPVQIFCLWGAADQKYIGLKWGFNMSPLALQ